MPYFKEKKGSTVQRQFTDRKLGQVVGVPAVLTGRTATAGTGAAGKIVVCMPADTSTYPREGKCNDGHPIKIIWECAGVVLQNR